MWSALIGGAANLFGGALNRSAGEKANEMAANQAAMQIQAQERFAQNSLQWRADDVMAAYKKTGIHPLAMLGVQGSTYSPVTTAFTPASMGDSIAKAGQDISGAITRGADRELRAQQLELQRIQMNNAAERGVLENEALRLQIQSQRMRLAQEAGPAMPGPRDKTLGGTPIWQEKKHVPGVGHLEMPGGAISPVKSDEAQKRLEDDVFGNIKHFVMRTLGPMINPGSHIPAGRKLKPGFKWYVDWKGDYHQVPIGPGDLWKRGRHGSQRN